MCKSVVVEHIDNGESSRLQSQSGDVHFFGKLQQIGIKLLLFPSESPRLTKENSCDVEVATKLPRFVRHGIRKGGHSMGGSEPEPLVILGIKINFAAGPNPSSE